MNWTDIPCNELLQRIFSSPPEVGEIDIFDVHIDREGPTVNVGFDLVDLLPDNAPEKWGKDFNRCRMGIYCFGVTGLSISGLAANIVAKINFEMGDGGVRVFITSDKFNLTLTCLDVSVTGPSVYKSD